jgi:hypothetical protein
MTRRRRTRSTQRRRRTQRQRQYKQKGGAEDKPTAVIIEPRQHRALPFVLRNFAENLPPEWSILVLHGTDNEAWLKEKLAEGGELAPHAARIKMTSLGIQNLSIFDYSKLLQSIDFHEKYIPSETFLIFQIDSIICKPHKDLLQKFLKYDYAGAPWSITHPGEVGNGGLSLRKKSKMIQKLRECPPKNPQDPEDAYFSSSCDSVKIYKPTFEEAHEFSIEQIYSPKSWGVHKPWGNPPWEHVEELEKQCPGVKELQTLY